MKQFKYRRLQTLSSYIRKYHELKETDPSAHLDALYDILHTSNIVSHINCNCTMMHNLKALKRKYPQYMDFFTWFQQTYNLHHLHTTISYDETDHITLDITDAHSATDEIEDAQSSIAISSNTSKRWWLLYLA